METDVPSPAANARVERLAINVPDLTRWITTLEQLLGPGFERSTVQQRSGPIEIAVHPAGIELVANTQQTSPSLRSFHLATDDIDRTVGIASELGWTRIDTVTLNERRYEVFDADGIRLLLVAPPPTGQA